jgi:Protein of unknown function (DUF742)
VTSVPPPEGQDGRRRIRPYLSTPAAEGQDAAGDGARPNPRPFVLTAGRVEATDPRIGVETQVAARVGAPVGSLAPQLRAIVDACVQPVSVGEISARLRLHLGVTQILIGDLRNAGLVDVYTVDHNQAHDPDMILRVIHGLRAIS